MQESVELGRVQQRVAQAKDHGERRFNHLTNNFYLMRAALRYFKVHRGCSFTSSKVSDSFPVAATVSGSALSALEDMGVIEPRNNSKSTTRYMPEDVDLELLENVRKILVENREIRKFRGTTEG